ncbi:MAG: TadE/TadG family type IV pilus assembly protein [Candidatus Acidiferrales bacterium]
MKRMERFKELALSKLRSGWVRWRALLPSSEGANLIEFALALPLLVVMLLGTIDVGQLAYEYIEVSNAARAGVAYGAQNHVTASDNPGMTQAAKNDALNISGLNATPNHFCECSDGSSSTCAVGDCSGSRLLEYVQVNTSATYQPWFPCPGIPSSVTVTGTAQMRAGE